MLLMLLRKLSKNKFMIYTLLAGNILMIAMMSSIPMYSRGILTKSIQRKLDDYYLNKRMYPGRYSVTKTLNEDDQGRVSGIFNSLDKIVTDQIMPGIGLPILSKKTLLSSEYISLEYEKGRKADIKIEAIPRIEDHITILNGRIFSREPNENNEYEIIVSETAMQNLHLVLNRSYLVYDEYNINQAPTAVKVVGVYRYRDINDPFWMDGDWDYPQSLLMDNNLFMQQSVGLVTILQWNYFFDYDTLSTDDPKKLTTLFNAHNSLLKKNYPESFASENEEARRSGLDITFPLNNILMDFMKTEKIVKTMLIFLQIPILMIFIIYIFMTSNLIVQQDRNEIALLKSRGAGTFQIVQVYIFESILISVIGLIAGPPLGVLLCKVMGASNGFLEFVQRSSLKVTLTSNEYLFSLYASVIFILTMALPALSAAKNSIVTYKQKKFRSSIKPVWERYYLDFFLLIISLYGFYSFNTQSGFMFKIMSSTDAPVDPTIYIISILYILSLVMIFLRMFPVIISVTLKLEISRWSTASFATLINVGRSKINNRFFMMFLILTISIGIFNLSTARTINTNMQSNLKYMTGADIIAKPYWDKNEDSKNKELIFADFSEIPGVSMATKVFRTNEAECDSGFYIYSDVYLMGVIPHEFGKTAWMQEGILYPHWNWYLNILTRYPNAVLMSNSYREKYSLKIGGPIEISLKNGEKFNGVIGGFVDYWPTVNINKPSSKYFVIANLNYMEKHFIVDSYEIWMKTDTQTSVGAIYDEISKKKLPIQEIKGINGEIIDLKNEPLLQGTNGSLSIGFISIVIMMIIGFLMFWILSIKDRQLEFGILRALGLSFKKILTMLIGENLLICGISIIAGTIIGKINTEISIPLIAISSNLAGQALPFRVISFSSDYLKLYTLIGIILVSGLVVIIKYISKMKIDQAIRLGED